ncbi:TetR/AcrR family transcriptional regulator [Psychrobacter aquaticus]|uniref:Transcriptional regulator, TetR family n=1 Tax=Psychrobacter aquaticus CMS 56 TaxID=1354303 RepID=U4T921_9GAMM|nr:TetR/AcrR family transcriptional regulator [Psychrobacter aquaticus]ERL56601.1 Transcriptional regulator, TetR family [Psychrobacter aquaticus CMS 56]
MTKANQPAKRKGGRPSLSEVAKIDARILVAATALFLEHGVDGTTFEAIANKANVSKPTLYARYSTKSDLFEAMIRVNVTSAMPSIADLSEGLSTQDTLRLVGQKMIREATKPIPLGLMRLYITEAPRHGVLIREVDYIGREAAVVMLSEAIVPTLNSDAIDHARLIADKFIDMAFIPYLMRMLLGDTESSLDQRIDDAILCLKSLKLID